MSKPKCKKCGSSEWRMCQNSVNYFDLSDDGETWEYNCSDIPDGEVKGYCLGCTQEIPDGDELLELATTGFDGE